MPASTLPADTAQHVDTPMQHFVPSYSDGFPAAAAGDSALGTIDTLAVMEIPPAGKAQPFARSPLHDTPSMALLLAGLLAVALSYHAGYKYIGNLMHYMISTRRRGNLFEDHTLHETTMLTALMANTCIVQGFFIYYAVQLFCPSLAPLLKGSTFLHIALFTALAAGFTIAQWLVFKVLGYTFTDKIGARLWVEGFKATQSLVGLLLLPVLVLLLLYPTHGKLLLSIGAVLYLVARLIFIVKGFRIFYSNLPSIVYFLLYLCAVEIVPLAVMAGLTVWLCGTLSL